MSRFNRDTFVTLNTQESQVGEQESVSRRETRHLEEETGSVRRVPSRSRSNQKVKIFGGNRALNLNPYVMTETVMRTVG
jgi:hypothetical protein